MYILSIFLALSIWGLINLGIYAFFPSPKYETYCPQKQLFKAIENEQECISNGGKWQFYIDASRPSKPDGTLVDGSCDLDYYCRQTYDKAFKDYERIVFYILTVVGFALLIVSIFNRTFMIQLISLFSGGISVVEAIIRNFNDTKLAFFTLLLLIIVVGYFAYKKYKRG